MYIVLIIFSLCVRESVLLRMVRVSVPAYRVRGQAALLQCDFALEGDALYSVKWYRDAEEFYRYMPNNDRVEHAYRLDGVKVDLSKSDARRVWLSPVTLRSRGLYRCEVSAEAPSFASVADEGRMEVIYLPKEGPKITSNELENGDKDFIELNCTSARSYPAATLSWEIDGVEVTDSSMLVRYPATEHAHGLQSVSLGLRVPAGRSLHTRCAARVAPDVLHTAAGEAMLLVHSASERARCAQLLLSLTAVVLISRASPTLSRT